MSTVATPTPTPAPAPPAKTIFADHQKVELNAISQRVAQRRVELFTQPAPYRPYDSTDLADAEWLIFELGKALGQSVVLTPAEVAKLEQYDKAMLANLTVPERAIRNRLAGLHGQFSPQELVEWDYLNMRMRAALSPAGLIEFDRLRGIREAQEKKA